MTSPAASPPPRRQFYRNWLTLTGLVVMVASLFAFLLLFVMDSLARGSNPYIGVLTYLVAPIFTTMGLVLVAVGLWLARRKLIRSPQGRPGSLVIDLARPRDRRLLGGFILASVVFLLITAIGSYHSYHFTESVTFCGEACHTVMEPEKVRYEHSAHARVSCAECHIGPGASWFVRSKLSGLYQVYAAAANKYPRPVPTPIRNLRPAQDTCEQCHWPQKFSGNIVKTYRHFLSDEENTEYSVRLLLRVGGGDPQRHHEGGIHWHINNHVEYVAADDKRLKIPWVRYRDERGELVEYRAKDFTNDLAGMEIRKMDCMDCHNRPSHRYETPNEAVDLALANGRLDRTLPSIRAKATELLVQKYPTVQAALDQIEKELQAAYPDDARTRTAVAAVQEIYRQNFFPLMNADWRAYPEHIGHKDWPGCFRCHDDQHLSADGTRKITFTDCNTCHVILAQGTEAELENLSGAGQPFKHPEDEYDPAYLCNDCHDGGP
ncbi:MAG: NapC/NirT family cytochrome c [Verrucomicrobia bacterium]|jgi:fumarate reductase subunit C|nr:NapC/NirT family cytochrome c [Verrucomicrobiota bacterium]